ncbi:MAG TPA: bacteriohopanetetrol glucosamine biosynthesis glycosyltransferase HpnI [Terriglobales bacterium]|jgi:ceramide glucosyltransferase|nr:bacteriohopanetetrol glucosamine biosynthesis glycosyltransferase HpnI [Terriglobales bacterium]
MLSFLLHYWYELVPLVPTLAGVGYQVLVFVAVWQFSRLRANGTPSSNEFTPPVSLLKPVKGYDPGAYESFRSHCVQDYPEYEIVFGLSRTDDDAAPLIEQLRREFPHIEIRVVVCSQLLGMNPKVAKVMQLAPAARYEHLVINDGDIRVEKDYLRHLMRPFKSKEVGLVTCLYSASADKSLCSRLEALCLSTDFAAGVLASRTLEGGLHFGFGATLALPRTILQNVGDLESLVNYLSDDYELGCRISHAGFKVELADQSVQTYLPPYTWSEFFTHQMRLMRGVRDSRPWGYLGSTITYVIPWAMITALIAGGAPWSLLLLAIACGLRFSSATLVAAGVLRDRQIWRDLWLLPLRDWAAAIMWVASFAGHTVIWRDHEYILQDGKLLSKAPAAGDSQPPVSFSSPKQ